MEISAADLTGVAPADGSGLNLFSCLSGAQRIKLGFTQLNISQKSSAANLTGATRYQYFQLNQLIKLINGRASAAHPPTSQRPTIINLKSTGHPVWIDGASSFDISLYIGAVALDVNYKKDYIVIELTT